jgi:predicted nucleic acid-binding protein
MKAIVFDTGPVISLTINSLLWVLEELRKEYKGEFYITPAVYDELINKPLSTRKYKLEALQVLPYITKGTLKVYNNLPIITIAKELEAAANRIFQVEGTYVQIVHRGEIEAVATAVFLKAEAIAIDERTTRHLIESPERIAQHMESTMHKTVTINSENLKRVKELIGNLKVIRSVELVTVAYEKGFLNKYTENAATRIVPNIKQAVLEGALWGVKLNGCSVKEEEINDILKMEK